MGTTQLLWYTFSSTHTTCRLPYCCRSTLHETVPLHTKSPTTSADPWGNGRWSEGINYTDTTVALQSSIITHLSLINLMSSLSHHHTLLQISLQNWVNGHWGAAPLQNTPAPPPFSIFNYLTHLSLIFLPIFSKSSPHPPAYFYCRTGSTSC